MRKITILLFCLLCITSVYAQVTFTFQPQLQGTSYNGLWQVRIHHRSSTEINGVLKMKVQEISQGNVVTVTIPLVKLRPGVNGLSRSLMRTSSTRYGSSAAARVLSNTGKFPEGSYQFCFEFTSEGGKNPVVDESCFDHVIMPQTPLLLTDPLHESQICNVRPDFSWQPPMPVEPGTRFRLMLVETDSLEAPADAIFNRTPVVNQANILQSWMRYPANVPALEVGKYYAWQVMAYKDGMILTKSEIWRFKVACNEEPKPGVPFDSYRELKPVLEGDYYVAEKIIRFSLHNAYGPGKLEYTITDLADPAEKPKKLPVIDIRTGVNNIDLDPGKNKFFRDGGQYLLKVRLAGQTLQLRFIYKSISESR